MNGREKSLLTLHVHVHVHVHVNVHVHACVAVPCRKRTLFRCNSVIFEQFSLNVRMPLVDGLKCDYYM